MIFCSGQDYGEVPRTYGHCMWQEELLNQKKELYQLIRDMLKPLKCVYEELYIIASLLLTAYKQLFLLCMQVVRCLLITNNSRMRSKQPAQSRSKLIFLELGGV